MSLLELPVIPATSPTLAEVMQLCQLRAGLSKATGSSTFVLGNPKAWLGIAYHEVLERIAETDFEKETVDTAVERLWTQAVAAQHQCSCHHVLDRRFGAPETWPGYHLARASVLLRARELVADAAVLAPTSTARAGARPPRVSREREFTALDGRLVGRPDVIRPPEVIDYKSGAIMDFDEIAQAEVVKAAYVRQLRIYGFLVKENLGWWPQRGLLLPLAGSGVEVALDPTECTHAATEAVTLLERYNRMVQGGVALEDLASPMVQHCRWCPYKLLCSPFWRTASPEWSGRLEGAAVEGIVAESPRVIHAGAARAVSLDIQNGTEARHRTQIAPLSLAFHSFVGTLVAGDRVRMVGLRTHPNGVLVPGERSVMCLVGDVPAVTTPRKRETAGTGA